MFGRVALNDRPIDGYAPIVGEGVVEDLRALARPLRDARVLHLNVMPIGTEVSELLLALVPLMAGLGLRAQWQVVRTGDDFLAANKAIYNALGGSFVQWSSEMADLWTAYGRMNAQLFDGEFDFVVIHDPQPAIVLPALLDLGREQGARWVWHSHLDLREAQEDVWHELRRCLEPYDAVIFDAPEWVRGDVNPKRLFVIPPAIDPLGTKNMPLSSDTVEHILSRHNLDWARPLVSQTSPFDRWSEPLGLVDAYEEAKREIKDLQLLLVASMVSDEPETRAYYHQVAERAEHDPDFVVVSSLNRLGNVELNAFQRASDVVVQNSLRKGFGLGVAEAMWKERPVIGGCGGGIPHQIVDGETGYLVQDVKTCARLMVRLLSHPRAAHRIGLRGREHVRRNFLITRYLRDYLRLLNQLG